MSNGLMKSLAATTIAVSALGLAYLPATAQSLAPNQNTSATQVQNTSGTQWLSMAQIIAKIEAAGFQDIREVERERRGYEAKVRDAQGQKIKLKLDPFTGEIVQRKLDD